MGNLVKKLSDSDTLLDLLIQAEDFMDNLDLYAFENWIDGEIVEGPEISKYWVTFSLMYDYDHMPDPAGAIRMINSGIKVDYKEIEVQDNNIPTDPKDRISIDTVMTATNPNAALGSRLDRGGIPVEVKNIKKWLITITIPRQFIDDLNNINLYTFDDDVEDAIHTEFNKPSNDISQVDVDNIGESITEGLRVDDLKDLCLDTITIDRFKSKINDNCVVLAFYVLYKEPANDLNSFIQKTAVDIIDSDVSPAPTEDGYYIVFVELQRNNKLVDNILYLLVSIEGLTGVDKWYFRSKDGVFPATEKNLEEKLKISNKEKIKEHLKECGFKDIKINGNRIILENQEYDFLAFGKKDKILEKFGVSKPIKKNNKIIQNEELPDALVIKKL